jgi:hypothetical protein
MANHFKDDSWSYAYAQIDMPDTLSKYAAGASAAFATKIVAIRPTGSEFDQFYGINANGTNFVIVDANVSFNNAAKSAGSLKNNISNYH